MTQVGELVQANPGVNSVKNLERGGDFGEIDLTRCRAEVVDRDLYYYLPSVRPCYKATNALR